MFVFLQESLLLSVRRGGTITGSMVLLWSFAFTTIITIVYMMRRHYNKFLGIAAVVSLQDSIITNASKARRHHD